MKKTLIALAAVVATGAAFAQSSVTMYGVADIAVGDDNVAGTKFRAFANGLMNNGNSRLGVRGTEDLGGGLKASFNFEQAVNLANGATDANTWQRAAWMELSGGFGAIRAGRSLSPSFFGIAAYELTGTANYSALANQFGFGAGTRNNAMITYTTPNMSGLTASVGTVLSGNDADAARAGLQSKYDLNVIYKAGPIAAALTYGKVQSSEKSWSLGGSYNLGMATVAASYQDPAGAKKGFTLGVSAPVGPVTLTADLARATDGGKNTDFVLEAKYPLSKRTFAYGVFLRDGGVSGTKSVNSYAVGVRHNF